MRPGAPRPSCVRSRCWAEVPEDAGESIDPSPFVAVAERAAKAAGQILKGLQMRVGVDLAVEFKGEVDLVTEADRASERSIVAAIRERFPDHTVLGEEGGRQPGRSEFCWYVDPLDGTTNYAHGLPVYAVSIGLWRGEAPVAGVVYAPGLDELFVAGRGLGAALNGRAIRVSQQSVLRRSLLATGFPYDAATNPENNLDHFGTFVHRAQAVRRLGAAALDLAYVAAGRFDGFWEARLQPWDIAAGAILIAEAGGQLSDFRGAPFDMAVRNVVASNGRIHGALLAGLTAGHTGRGG